MTRARAFLQWRYRVRRRFGERHARRWPTSLDRTQRRIDWSEIELFVNGERIACGPGHAFAREGVYTAAAEAEIQRRMDDRVAVL